MAPAAGPADPRAIEALLAFWADAGVDACLGEAPVDRLAAPPAASARAPAPPPPPPSPARAPAAEPDDRVGAARRLAAEAQDLPALAAAAAALFPGALALEGAAPARLLVLGDAPGPEDEAARGLFRGPRGALVRALLAAAGLGEDVLYLNSVFRRVAGGGDPPVGLQAQCAPFVARAAVLAAPRAVLLLGACAARAATGAAEPILRLRGRWLEWTPEGAQAPLPALVTLGPDFLLRHPASKKAAWADVLSLAARLDRPDAPA